MQERGSRNAFQPVSQAAAERRLAGLMTRLDHARRQLDQQSTLGTSDMRLLWLFNDGGSRTLRQIAEQLGLEQSTVNRQVNAAVNHGLLVKTRERPGESYRLRRSTAGERQFEQALDETLGIYQHALDGLGADAEPFLLLLEHFVQTYQQAVDGSS